MLIARSLFLVAAAASVLWAAVCRVAAGRVLVGRRWVCAGGGCVQLRRFCALLGPCKDSESMLVYAAFLQSVVDKSSMF